MSAVDTGVFVGRWHTAARHGSATEAERSQLRDLEAALQVTVRAQRDLAQLSSTPLMCALICALHRDRRGHLPHSRMELYEAALSMLLVRRDLERSIDVPEGIQLTEHQSVQLLQRLAYWLIRNRQTEMDRATALALVGDALPAMQAVAEQGTADQVLAHLVGRSGLLRQPTMDTIDFVHRTFQDYLGAKAAIETHDFPLLVNNAHDDQWEDVIRMAVAHARPAESADLLRRLVERGDAEDEYRNRLHLLAAASLQYATEIEPDARRLVEQRAHLLMPPRSREEAEALAALGPGILDLLPGPQGLEDDEVGPVVETAAAIGGDQAYGFLRRFAQSLPPDSTPHELFEGWEHFEADQYARDILLPCRGQDRLYAEVHTHDQRNALRLLKPITGIHFQGEFTEDQIFEHLSPEHTHTLRISSGRLLRDLKFIRKLPALKTLELSECTQLAHLEDLAGTPLTNLRFTNQPREFCFDALDSLPELTSLSFYTHLPSESLSDVPAPEGLTSLNLGWTDASLRGISRWQQLQELAIADGLDNAAWQEIATLPNLTELCISGYDLKQAVPLPGVSYLRLISTSDPQLNLVPNLFPNLQRFFINCQGAQPDTTDITPLSQIKGLQISISYASNVTGLERFTPEAVGLYPRPRTAST